MTLHFNLQKKCTVRKLHAKMNDWTLLYFNIFY